MFELKPIFFTLIRSKVGVFLLMLQIAITLAIVANASSIIKSRIDYVMKETGYPEEQLIRFTTLVFSRDTNLIYLVDETERTLREMEGVANATYLNEVPLSGSGSASSFGILPVDQRESEEYRQARAAYTGGGIELLDTLGLEVSEGRMFEPSDVISETERSVAPTSVIVTRDYLNAVYPEGNGLGQSIYIGNEPVKIIGVVERAMGPWPSDNAAYNVAFFPYRDIGAYQKFVVRTEPGMREQVIRNLEDKLLAQFAQRVIMSIEGLDEAKEDQLASDYLMLRMLSVLIILLVAITALGIFGMTVFNISKRTKQIGTRRALGARKSAIVRYFLIETSIVCIAGMVLGAVGALIFADVLFNNYSVPAFDPVYIGYTAVFVLIVSLLSVVFPANRAANISPSIATRTI